MQALDKTMYLPLLLDEALSPHFTPGPVPYSAAASPGYGLKQTTSLLAVDPCTSRYAGVDPGYAAGYEAIWLCVSQHIIHPPATGAQVVVLVLP